MKALIFAAGLGTRLRPLTHRMPKALVPVAGVPMLQRVLFKLRDAGIDSFVVNVHHFAEQIEDFLTENGNFGVPDPAARLQRLGRLVRDGDLRAEVVVGGEELFNLLREMVHVDHERAQACVAQLAQHAFQHRPARHGDERLGHRVRERTEPGTEPGGEDQRFHRLTSIPGRIVRPSHSLQSRCRTSVR